VIAEKSQLSATENAPGSLSDLIPLCREIGNLKRIRAAESGDAPENHAEHCLAVAVTGALVANRFDAKVETVFLCRL
jgi:5'-deoxynucleotidase YfbR-like HD superfamily hydrolase